MSVTNLLGLTLRHSELEIIMSNLSFISRFYHPGPYVIKLFTTVIYHHSMVIWSICVIKQHFLGNYCAMAVNYHGISVANAIKRNLT
jgi:hypothetical protein